MSDCSKNPISYRVKKEMFDYASHKVVDLLKNGKYAEAEREFQHFVTNAKRMDEKFFVVH